MKKPSWRLSAPLLLPLAAAFLSFAAPGCAVEDVYLQNLRADGPVTLPPVHVTTDSMAMKLRFSPRISWNNRTGITGRIDGHSLVNSRGVYEVDSSVFPSGTVYRENPNVNTSQFRGKNLEWNTPQVQVGLDMEYAVSNGFALTGFVEYSRNTQTDFLAMGAGMAVLFGKGEIGGRLEGGVLYRDVSYDLQYVVTSRVGFSSTPDVYFRSERRKDQTVNVYGALTLNTKSPTSLVNGLLSLALSGGSLISMGVPSPTGGSAGDVQGGSTLLSVSPGIFIDIGREVRFLTCVRFVVPLGVEDAAPSSFIMPMAKFEFAF